MPELWSRFVGDWEFLSPITLFKRREKSEEKERWKVNEMDEDRRKWIIGIIVMVLVIPLILIYFIFGPTYYESLDIVGKRVFMLPGQIVIIVIGYYVGHWFMDRRSAKGRRDKGADK